MTLSDGKKIRNSLDVEAHEKKIKQLQRHLARKKKGSKNRVKTRMALGKAWRRQRKSIVLALLGAIILFVYGIIPTLQPSGNFGRIYAAYGGIFIGSSIVWGRIIDKKKPDRYEVAGSIVAVIGAAIIFYAPR
jgi:drug/metabolite transporter superfamily protein YnfA